MTAVVLLKAAERRAQPWKNGGGTTTEVCVYPPGSGLGEFEWRMSIAEVATAGPFSSFPGVDRILTILDGELELTLEGDAGSRVLTAHSDPFLFAGDVPCHGNPLSPIVRDLNVMVRRSDWLAQVERLDAGDPRRVLRHDGPSVLLACTSLLVDVDGHPWALAALDAVLLPAGSAASLTMRAASDRVIFTRLTRL